MAAFGVDIAGGLVDAMAPAAAAAAGGVPRVSARVLARIHIVGNVFSLVSLLIPLASFVWPAYKAKDVGNHTVYGFLYAIPDDHRDKFSMAVNCVSVVAQALYVYVYIKYAVDINRFRSILALQACGAITFGVGFFIVFVVIFSHIWSIKVVGITASTYGTAMFLTGVVDIVMLVTNQRSGFNTPRLLINLVAASIWISSASLSDPVNPYVLAPNIAGVGVTIFQLIFHLVLVVRDYLNPPAAAAANGQLAAAAVAAAAAAAANGQPADAAANGQLAAAAVAAAAAAAANGQPADAAAANGQLAAAAVAAAAAANGQPADAAAANGQLAAAAVAAVTNAAAANGQPADAAAASGQPADSAAANSQPAAAAAAANGPPAAAPVANNNEA